MRKKTFKIFMNTSVAAILSLVMLASPLSSFAMETNAEEIFELEVLTESEADTAIEAEDEALWDTDVALQTDITSETDITLETDMTLETEEETIFITETAPKAETEDEYTIVIWTEDDNGELVPIAEDEIPALAGPLYGDIDTNSSLYVDKNAVQNTTPGIQTFAGTYTTLSYSGTNKYSYAWDVLALMNQERAKAGVSTLTMDKALLDTAMLRAQEIALTFDHIRPDGTLCFTAETTTPMHGENIAAAQKTPQAVMNSWMNSPGHKSNILASAYRSAGVGCFEIESTYYWVQVFSTASRTATSRPADRKVTANIKSLSSILDGFIAVTGEVLREGKTFSVPFLVYDRYNILDFGVIVNPTTVQWSSSNTNAATINANGLVTARRGGTTTITGALKDNTSIRDTYKIEVVALTPIERFVARCYTHILEREYDDDGLLYWSSYLAARRLTAADVANQMLLSREFTAKNKTNSAFVDILYRTFMGREPDTGGKNYWVNILNNGVSRRGVVARFINSTEFTQISNSYGITKGSLAYTETRDININLTMYVYRCYSQTLGRAADVGGLNYWTGIILNGTNSAKAVAESILFSTEFQNKNTSNTDFVKVLYRTYMGREFDAAGLNYWVGLLNSGMTRRQVAASFGNSPEFQAIMNSFGV